MKCKQGDRNIGELSITIEEVSMLVYFSLFLSIKIQT